MKVTLATEHQSRIRFWLLLAVVYFDAEGKDTACR